MFRRSKVLAKLRAGQVARVCNLPNYLPFFPRMAAHFGYDAVWVDNEHRPFDVKDAQSLIAYHHLAAHLSSGTPSSHADIRRLCRPGV